MTSTPPFVHLHCHSHFSLLDGASRIPELVQRAQSLGMNALAITDHGNLHGALEFYTTATEAGIKPIIGYEAYIAAGSRLTKEPDATGEASYHLTLLAQNHIGYKNLIKLASAGFLEGFHRKPRIDKELLEAHNEGLICLSGCVSGEFSRSFLRGGDPQLQFEEAQRIAAWFANVFGDRYYIEIQNNGLEIQKIALEGAVDVAHRMGIPLVATSDAHYVNRGDAEAQDVLLCINTGRFRTDVNRLRMEGDQFYLRSGGKWPSGSPTSSTRSAAARRSPIASIWNWTSRAATFPPIHRLKARTRQPSCASCVWRACASTTPICRSAGSTSKPAASWPTTC
jgi:DNA polymerase-3 subunit alpha